MREIGEIQSLVESADLSDRIRREILEAQLVNPRRLDEPALFEKGVVELLDGSTATHSLPSLS
jgi:hypothetical protein